MNDKCITEGCEEPNKGKWSGGYCTDCVVFIVENKREPTHRTESER